MTRINCVPPEELSGKHLVAEYRELPRLFKLIVQYHDRLTDGDGPPEPDLPPAYTLGKGHVRFFYDKAQWLVERQHALVAEMLRRGYSPTHRNPELLLMDVPTYLRGHWTPSEEAMRINRARIKERTDGQRD